MWSYSEVLYISVVCVIFAIQIIDQIEMWSAYVAKKFCQLEPVAEVCMASHNCVYSSPGLCHESFYHEL